LNREIINPDLIYPGQITNFPKMTPIGAYIVRPGNIVEFILNQRFLILLFLSLH